MTLADKEQHLINRLRLIEDSQERLAALVSRGKKWPAPAEAERTDAVRVSGCVSRVWLIGRVEEGKCHFRMAADSPMVQGLVSVLCEIVEGEPVADVAAFEPTIVTALGLDRQLSPTRLNGLSAVGLALKAFARRQIES